MKIKVFEAFAGYGSQAMALRRLKDRHPDFDFEVVGISKSQQYKLAGNSIVVNCMTLIFENLFFPPKTDGEQLSLF